MKKLMSVYDRKRYMLIEKGRLLIRKISRAVWPSSRQEIAQERLKSMLGIKIKEMVANWETIIAIIGRETEEMILREDLDPGHLRVSHH